MEGILTIPSDSEKFPVVILASGSGPNNFDEEWSGHAPFSILADFQTDNGVAVLRLNDRDFEKNSIEFSQNTTADCAKDFEEAVTYLQHNEETKDSPIGLLGHSEGGIV